MEPSGRPCDRIGQEAEDAVLDKLESAFEALQPPCQGGVLGLDESHTGCGVREDCGPSHNWLDQSSCVLRVLPFASRCLLES